MCTQVIAPAPPALHAPTMTETDCDAVMSGDDSQSDNEWSIMCDPEEDTPTERELVFDVARAARASQETGRRDDSQAQHDGKRRNLQGRQVPVEYKKEKTTIVWTVSDSEDGELTADYKKDTEIGLTNFNFRMNEVKDSQGRPSRINFMKLLFAFLPGNVYHLLLKMNARIDQDNKDRRKGRVLPVSPREWARFLGVFLVPVLEGKKGGDLWMGNVEDGEGYWSQIDISRYMTKHRHSQLRKYFSFLYANESQKQTDPWWMASDGIRAFNHNRRETFKPSGVMVLDESMSAYKPRTTKTGELLC